ncbi:MAG TPA: 5-formyltetrahydrofolate cyclo-ligase [Geminicoccaceae bacterium]
MGPPAGRPARSLPLSAARAHSQLRRRPGGGRTAVRVEPWRSARRIKVNPDAPQRPVREAALRRGITVFVPTPRLRAGFKKLDPARIPDDQIRAAASLSQGARFGEEMLLEALPAMDAIVCGSVAVTRDGRRCGKGEGYSDLEYAILRELGHPPVPVATTVHPVQIVRRLPRDPTDLPLSLIVTPHEVVRVPAPPPAPAGIDWARLSEADLAAMPVLRELAQTKRAG